MADYWEIVETAAACVSTMTTESVVVATSVGVARPTWFLALNQTLISTAAGTSTLTQEAYALLTSTSASSSLATPSAAVTKELTSAAAATSTCLAAFANTALSTAAASGIVDAYVDNVVTSIASAVATVTPGNVAVLVLTSTAASTSAVTKGLLESVIGSAAATNVVIGTNTPVIVLTSTSNAVGSVPSASSVVSLLEGALESSALATAITTMQVNRTVYAQSIGYSNSSALFRDPNDMAWVMNTETAALSQYTNFAFNSIAYANGKVYAACLDGIYVLEGNDDEGAHIRAEAVSGFDDLGEQHTKHAGSVYFGYTSDGPVVVGVETYGSGHAKQTYELEQRVALAPRNNRVKIGKGLSSRHWRITVKNKGGSRFELNDAAIDVAVSQRRV